jgi:hypothetical protein
VTSDATNNNGDGYSCYTFDGISDCNKLLDSIPVALHTVYSLTMITLFTALILSFITATAVYRPQYIDANVTATTATIIQHPQPPTADVYVVYTEPATSNPIASRPVQGTVVDTSAAQKR